MSLKTNPAPRDTPSGPVEQWSYRTTSGLARQLAKHLEDGRWRSYDPDRWGTATGKVGIIRLPDGAVGNFYGRCCDESELPADAKLGDFAVVDFPDRTRRLLLMTGDRWEDQGKIQNLMRAALPDPMPYWTYEDRVLDFTGEGGTKEEFRVLLSRVQPTGFLLLYPPK